MLATAATTLSALQKCFRLQPQHSQLCRNASHCSHSTLSFAEMLPTAATALSAKCNNIQIPKFRTEHFSSFVCSCVLHANAISRPRKGDPTLSGPVVNLSSAHFDGCLVVTSWSVRRRSRTRVPIAKLEVNFDRVRMPQTSTASVCRTSAFQPDTHRNEHSFCALAAILLISLRPA